MSSPTTTIPDGAWVLVTGATGFVAGHVVNQFLQRGYRVRGTVRDLNQASWLVQDTFKSYAESGSFEVVAVADLAADGTFDEAVKDPNAVIPQSVAGATSILTAATKEHSVKVVVYTSSIVAAIVPVRGQETFVDRNTWNEAILEAAWAPPPYEPSRAMITYAASKTAAEKAVWAFVEEKKPPFTVNVVSPAGVIGAPFHVKHVEKPGHWVAALFRNDKAALDPYPSMFFVDVEDVAAIHVAAILDPEIKNARLQTWGHSSNWNEFFAVLREIRPHREFPADYPDPYFFPALTDQSKSIAILKKWASQDGWKPLKDSLRETVENPYFRIP
ncbi:aldehyde reductase [Verticillium alfalfae VaMs.102]|uniref:Aldehyde reductase n=1 Tax=Verticillium alfalfae (strain VaMs.102 / ATCC MYA-4576 / FGSC 10136) TaxID=526221 RepID=C9SEU7_VERA1|nr:aldehyde reductase [Verticillium alfalfae VaMs.102]EEY16690.1 aldehyde reductase [Verticillium alfalfae VaMs.102]